MTDNSYQSTAREALIIEAIGDIGELINRVEALKGVTAPYFASLEKSQADAIAVVQQHTHQQQQEFRTFTEMEKAAFDQKLQASMDKVASQLEAAGKLMANELGRPAGLPLWKQASIALAIAIIASLLSIGASYRMFGREQDSQAAIGKAVMQVWDELDEKTKARIEQEY
ncbi:MAG: hypothetical protein NTV43_00230 [Methylococcales bacterium]|nr:hypothetical protein [Methylococcales bacterium]